MSRQFNFRIPDQLSILLKQQAELEGKTQTDLVITAIEHYLRSYDAVPANQTLAKSSLEFQRHASSFNSIEALLPLANQAGSPDISNSLSNRLTSSLEAQVQEAISTLARRISVLEISLIQQGEMGKRSGSNPELDRQQNQPQDFHLSNLRKTSGSLDTNFKNGPGTAPANGAPLQKASQAPGAQAASNERSLMKHVESSPTPATGREPELDVPSNSLKEQPQFKIRADDEWITPQAAYEHAKTKGYPHSFDAFRLSTTNKKDPAAFFADLGLSYDPARRVSRGVTSKCFRRIEK